MKKQIMIALICSAATCMAIAADQMPEVQEARGLVKNFFGELKGQLQSAMKSGGPVNAITVCNVTAPAIARNLAYNSGWEVGRTSLKLRNPDNSPDTWEKSVLEDFAARKAAGEAVEGMEFSQVVDNGDGKSFRYMKAIPVGDVCLKCHGSDIAPAVQEHLKKLYPGDQAKGYALGDIRGAFTLSKSL